MHELSIMSSILDIVTDYANRNNANRILSINLEIGELSDIIPHWMQQYFDIISNGTIAENAKLVIDKIPAFIRCVDCGAEFRLSGDDWQFFCPKCESTDVQMLSGREFTVKSIEVE
ncbi:MAG: hydrogenase maturation nickel metallochaperone HypA [Spirochaetota bacterium]|nr:hydrogenase maturation nickel metallochaperone HypA [Spirochaetota bacterium]